MNAPYKTVRRQAQDEFVVNKSRFIGQAAPTASEEAALAFLRGVRERRRDASHNCYAYIVGRNAGVMRYSDDGEPGGTAGMPILEVLRAQGVTDCCVVVTRYFGGILLGAGGLCRAYTQGSAVALKAAGVVVMEPSRRYLCEVGYPLWDRVRHALKSLPARLADSDFAASVTFSLLMREKDAQCVLDALAQITDGRLTVLPESESYEAWDAEDSVERKAKGPEP